MTRPKNNLLAQNRLNDPQEPSKLRSRLETAQDAPALLASELDPQNLGFYLIQDHTGQLSVFYGAELEGARKVLNLEAVLGAALPMVDPSFGPLRELLEKLETLAAIEATARPALILGEELELPRSKDLAMNHTSEILTSQTDWDAMAQHKSALFALIESGRADNEQLEALEGVLNFLDALMDAAHEDGVPGVFVATGEEETQES